MLGSTIQRELAEIIQRDLHDPRLMGFPSITRVKVSPDLAIADVYVTVMGTPGQQTAALNALKHSAGLMRGRLTKSLSLRQAPFIQFRIDEELKRELAVLDLIAKATREADERGAVPAVGEAEPIDGEAVPAVGESAAIDGREPTDPP